jgi:hypothetical protein
MSTKQQALDRRTLRPSFAQAAKQELYAYGRIIEEILHAVSFIRWPLRLDRMFIYFILAFVQSIAYSNLTNPKMWFFWLSLFSLVGLGLYLLDLRLIRLSRPLLMQMPGGKDLFDEIERRHLYEVRVQVPAALLFNLAALGLLILFPGYFAGAVPLAMLGSASALATLAALIDCMANFTARSRLIARCFEPAN